MGRMTVYLTDGTSTALEVDKAPTLEQLQKLVGGYIEIVHVLYNGQRAQMIVNDEGHIHGMPPNHMGTAIYHATARLRGYVTGHLIVGDVVVLEGSAMLK